VRLVAHHSQNGTHLELFLGRCSVNHSLGLARLLLSEGFEPLGVVRADFSSCLFLASVVLASEEVQLEREGTDSSTSLCSSGKSCKLAVPQSGARILETRETTEGSAELKFRIHPPPAKSHANQIHPDRMWVCRLPGRSTRKTKLYDRTKERLTLGPNP
jgi:hypothetical protein